MFCVPVTQLLLVNVYELKDASTVATLGELNATGSALYPEGNRECDLRVRAEYHKVYNVTAADARSGYKRMTRRSSLAQVMYPFTKESGKELTMRVLEYAAASPWHVNHREPSTSLTGTVMRRHQFHILARDRGRIRLLTRLPESSYKSTIAYSSSIMATTLTIYVNLEATTDDRSSSWQHCERDITPEKSASLVGKYTSPRTSIICKGSAFIHIENADRINFAPALIRL